MVKRQKDTTTDQVVKEWELGGASSSYSQEEFYTKATDVKGHSATVHLRVLPDIVSQLEEVCQTHKFPYATVQDIIRDAVIHRLQYIRGLLASGNVDTWFMRILDIDAILREEESDQKFREHIEKLTGIVEGYLAVPGGQEEAHRIVKTVFRNIEAMPDSFKKQRYIKMLEQRFGHLAQGQGDNHHVDTK